MKNRPFEVLFVIALVAVAVGWFRPGLERTTDQPAEVVDLKDPRIGYELTFNRLRPGMTVKQAEAIFGPPDFTRGVKNYQQWEKPLTQVHYNDQGVLTEVGGSGRGQLYLGDKVVFRCGVPEAGIEQVFGPPLSVDGIEYHYPGMVIYCGSAQGEMRWVSAIVLGSHD